jgi:hypothetical protein
LNRAARSYRDPDGKASLEGLPPLITMLPENPRFPYRSIGKSKMRCSTGYRRTSRAWHALPINTGYETATFAAYSGSGKFAYPRCPETWHWPLVAHQVDPKVRARRIWIVSFMHYDRGYIDLEQKTLQPLDNPFGARLLPMS